MATEVNHRTIATSTEANLKKGKSLKPTEPILDHEGNIIPYPGYTPAKEEEVKVLPKSGYIRGPPKKEICPPSPIPRLAAAGALDKPIPTAGQVGIERSKEPVIDIPAECYLYDEDRPWVLGKLNKEALDVPEPAEPIPLSKQVRAYLDALEKAVNAVNTAQVEAINAAGAEGKIPELDTDAMYAKEKAKISLPSPEEESKPAKGVKKGVKPKSRNSSPSPAIKGTKKSTAGKVSTPAPSSPRVAAQGSPATASPRVSQQLKPKVPTKSPGRGDTSTAKLATASPRSSTGAKKISNAK